MIRLHLRLQLTLQRCGVFPLLRVVTICVRRGE